jgi:hypothetical protein
MPDNTRRPPIKITAEAYDHLKALALAESTAKGPTSMLSLASAAILKLGTLQTQAEKHQPYILMGFHALADENCMPDLLVCNGIAALVNAIKKHDGFIYSEVLKVLPDGSTERLGNDPQLEGQS